LALMHLYSLPTQLVRKPAENVLRDVECAAHPGAERVHIEGEGSKDTASLVGSRHPPAGQVWHVPVVNCHTGERALGVWLAPSDDSE